METADSTSCSALSAPHQQCRRPLHPKIWALEKDRAGGGLGRVMIGAQCTKEAEITGVCTSLGLPVLEVVWGLELMQLLA